LQSSSRIDKAARLVKNSLAMFLTAAIVKGGGLIVTVLVARYLGASALGVFAVVQSMALLVEVIIPLGQQDVLVRTVARERSAMFAHWVTASTSSVLFSLCVTIALMLVAWLVKFDADTRLALCVAAISFPVAGLNLIAQAVLQGAEQMEHQTFAAFIGRLLGLLLLWLLLLNGSGIWAAFAGRAIFQLMSLIILSHAIWRNIKRNSWPAQYHPSIAVCIKSLKTALPFLLQRFLNDGLNRLNVIILPLLVSMVVVGFFNAAIQITQTSTMIIAIVMMTVLPLFSRTFQRDSEKSGMLSDQMMKFVLILIFPFTFFVTVAADKIILILYGTGYEYSVSILQLVIWSQVFLAADAVMKQNMIASDNEGAMVRRSAAALVANVLLTVTLSKIFGVFGIAAAVVLSSALLLMLDILFVSRHVFKPNLLKNIGKPFICAGLAGFAAFQLRSQHLVTIILLTSSAYLALLFLLKTFSGDELSLFKQLCKRFMTRTNGSSH
jgi:O-antigen/teichoic acid export membrane protein